MRLTIYIEAEKYLFSLKEILSSETQAHNEFVLNVFWGLLACEILNKKEQKVIEMTTLKKIKEIIEKNFNDQVFSAQESIN